MPDQEHEVSYPAVAVIGMAGKFPGAADVETYWQNLVAGKDTITRFTREQIESRDQASLEFGADYVAAHGVLDRAEYFDADFFSIVPRDAELMDPQHRLFLEACWNALEDGGYAVENPPGLVGVFGGCSLNTYLLANLSRDRGFLDELTAKYQVGEFGAALGNDKDFLCSRVAYKLNLRGPAVTVQGACATSLVAICQAAQSLLTHQCDMALAGGVSVSFPQHRGYTYQEGSIGSRDGRCRPFDEEATGTVFGHGVGVVLLKRLEDAVADGDRIDAVIRGWAVNNDGGAKVGYMAPGVEGQFELIAAAHAMAGINADEIQYVEAHGTATPLGDPVEVAALTRAFRQTTDAREFCALGSVKANIGHLDAAAGVSGFIKTILSLRHGTIPPLTNFVRPNPRIDLTDTPFYFSAEARTWKNGRPRMAGVSAFGVGGVNAHIVLEEAPRRQRKAASKQGAELLQVSARTQTALAASLNALGDYFDRAPSANLADAAFTLRYGRKSFAYRASVVAETPAQAAEKLRKAATAAAQSRSAQAGASAAFLFPGQGAQFAGMAAALYKTHPVYAREIDRCVAILKPVLGFDLLPLLLDAGHAEYQEKIHQTAIAQPALFVVEWAATQLWKSWGIEPKAMAGHSLGEYVAATLAGVFELEDALKLVALRGKLAQAMQPGAMLSVRLGEADVKAAIADDARLEIAALNSPVLSVVSGPKDAIEALHKKLDARQVTAKLLRTSHAFHSASMEPMLKEFGAAVTAANPRVARLPFVSTLTGTWITAEECVSSDYWVRHCRRTVRFSDAAAVLAAIPGIVLIEAGPGQALTTLVRQQNAKGLVAIASQGPDADATDTMLEAAGRAWAAGLALNWAAIETPDAKHRIALPTYPFETKRHWVEPPAPVSASQPVFEQHAVEQSQSTISPNMDTMNETRATRLERAVAELFAELSGITIDADSYATSFLELGFDSLLLTQVTQAVQKRFGVKVTFRQILEDCGSVRALAERLDAKMPADAFAAEATASAAAIPVQPTAAGSVEALIQAQTQAIAKLLEQQMAALKGVGAQASASPMPIPVSAPAAAAAEPKKAHGPFKPVQAGSKDGFTEQERAFIQALVERYNRKTPNSKQYTQQHRAHLADPRVVSGFRAIWKEMVYSIVTNRSRGSRLWDIDGNEYIDIVNGFGVILLGHSPDFVSDAVRKQIDLGVEIGPQSDLAGEVAERICKLTGMERVAFCNTGTEAVMAAMRVARTVTNRDTIVYFTGDYHGTIDEVLLRATPRGAAPIAPGVLAGAPGSIVILDYGTDAALEYLRANIDKIAAVMVEPVQSRHPEVQPAAFLKEVRAITETGGAALIFDEVVTGFRLTQGGAQNYYDIRADLVTYGKVIGGGYPIGVVAGRGPYLDALDGGFWSFGDDSAPEAGMTFFAGTFVRHPLAMAAALAVLKHLEDEGPALQEKLAERVAATAREIEAGFRGMGVDARFPACATWFMPHLPQDARFGSLLYYMMRERGVHVLESYPCFFTTAHTEADYRRVVEVFLEVGREMVAAGMLPVVEGLDAEPMAVPAIVAASSESSPLTEPQQEILLAAIMGSAANCAFNESVTLWLKGPADEKELCAAFEAAIDRHEVLRARVDMLGERLEFNPVGSIHVPFVDLTANERERSVALLEAEAAGEARKPFDLSAGPLFRATLFRVAPEEWALLATGHHLALDGWSANQLLEDASRIYSAGRQKRAASLLPVLPFSKYAADQRARQAAGEFRENEDFWVEIYKGRDSVLELPTDRPRPAFKSFSGATRHAQLSAEVTAKVRAAAARMGTTVYVTMLSAFEILLHRLTGQAQVVVGISTAGQSLVGEHSLVGHCVNFLPILSVADSGETAVEHTRKARAALLDAYDHQEFTYGTLLRKLAIPRDPSRMPLIEAQFNVEKLGDSIQFDGLKATLKSNPKAFVNTDIFLNAIEGRDSIDLTCDFNTDLFDESTIARWLASFVSVLEALDANADAEIAQLNILSTDDRSKMIREWNQTAVQFPPFQSVAEFVERRAVETPERVAAVCGREQWSYAQLNEYANRIASSLHRQGVGANDLIGVCLHRSLSMLGAVLGVMKAGAAYLPLDPTHPASRLELILDDAGAKLVLTEQSVAPVLGVRTPLFVLDGDDGKLLSRESAENPSVAVSAKNLAYVIYTSGSTGKPKGVAISHGALYNFLVSMTKEPGLSADDTLVSVTTLSFDIAALELFLPLVVGARVVIARREQVIDGFQLLALVKDSGATVMQATPSGWQLLIEAGWEGVPRLKVLCGGEALPRKLADTLIRYGSEAWNMYGPTETTIWSSATRLEAGSGPVIIGPPIANTQFYILNEAYEPVSIGIAGELFIGGDGLADGYWHRPELTAERFLANPFHAGRMYRTGDLARWLPDCHIEILGRTDFQVKVRGYRIELGEIEQTLAAHPAVREAVVTASTGAGGEKRLDAWLELIKGADAGNIDAEIQQQLQTNLPEYMRPSTITTIDSFPRTLNGKIDRKALLAKAAPVHTPPRREVDRLRHAETPEQAQLVTIFAELLGLDRVGIDENIFQLGADSLMVLRISTRAKKEGISVEPAEIFESRSIARLTEVLAARAAHTNGNGVRPAEPALRAVSRDKFRRSKA